jgi:hypothetical protein
VAKTLYLSSQNTINYYKSFCLVSKFWITNTTFFSSWNICFIISLISIIYLALVYNYNTIKCICFISPRQRVDMLSRVYIYIYAVIFLIKNQEKKNSNKASLINSILFGPSNSVRRKKERFLDNCHDRMRQIRDHFLRFYKFSQKATIGRSRIQKYRFVDLSI